MFDYTKSIEITDFSGQRHFVSPVCAYLHTVIGNIWQNQSNLRDDEDNE